MTKRMGREVWRGTVASEYGTVTGAVLRIHAADACRIPCAFHKPSDHHMADWPVVYRSDRRIIERTCEHGVGHPDPDDAAYRRSYGDTDTVHGCDGCCAPGGGDD